MIRLSNFKFNEANFNQNWTPYDAGRNLSGPCHNVTEIVFGRNRVYLISLDGSTHPPNQSLAHHLPRYLFHPPPNRPPTSNLHPLPIPTHPIIKANLLPLLYHSQPDPTHLPPEIL